MKQRSDLCGLRVKLPSVTCLSSNHRLKGNKRTWRRQRGAGGPWLPHPWIFMHDTDKVEGGLMMLFFGLVFLLAPQKIFLPTPL